MDRKLELLLDGLVFPEGPRWREDRLWFSDMHADMVCTVTLDGTKEDIVKVPNQPSGLGWDRDGRLLIVSMIDRKLLRFVDGGLEEVADLNAFATYHCNDMVVDSKGRAYVGNFGFDLDAGDPPSGTNLMFVDADGTVSVAAESMLFPNGAVISEDGKTLIVGETFGACLTAFSIAEDGSLSDRRVFAQLDGAVPDGICLDAEGAVWVASPISNEVLRVHDGGKVSERIALDRMGIACMLGGPDGRTLFALAAPDTGREKLRGNAPDSRIYTTTVDVPGAGRP